MSNKPLVSVIVPTRNSELTIGDCLKSIKNQTYKNLELIVIDNNSIDKTKDVSKRYTKLIFNKGPERSVQRNYGAKKAKGQYFLFIDSDMELTKNVVKECVEKIRVDKYKALVVPEKSFGLGFWAKCKALERSFYIGIDWIESARFFTKEVFNKFNGYEEKQTGTEDYDLPQRIKLKLGENTISRINSYINHNEGRLSLFNTLKKKFYYSKTAKIYAKSNPNYFNKQVNLFNRYLLYLSSPRRLFRNPFVGIGMLFMKTLEFMAGGLGYIFSKN